jgi:predicted dehydrogenase
MKQIGIIGCGKIAQVRHIPEYLENKDAHIAAVSDLNRDRAKEIAGKIGCKAYPTPEELLQDKSIDAVSVCTANITHADIAIKAMRAGKDVLCEKPMATTLDDCEEMVKVSTETGRILMIGQNQRLAKAHVWAKKLLSEGMIGKVLTFRTTFGHGGPETWSIDPGKNVWFFDRKKSAMGAMADLGIHKTDLIQYLLDDHVTETTARVVTLDKKDANGNLIGVDDNAICIYTMGNGTIGTMTASWTYYGEEDNSTVLYGTEGIMRIYDDPAVSIRVIKKSGEVISYDIDRIQTNDHQTKSGIIDQFVACLEEGKQPEISGRSVLPAMKAVFASIESSETGKSVRIE